VTLAPADGSIIFHLSCLCSGPRDSPGQRDSRATLILAATTFHLDRKGRDKGDGVERESVRPIEE